MRRRLIAIAAAALALGGVSAAQAQSRLDFNLVNRTGYQIDEVYVGPTTSNSWGSDILGQDTLPNAGAVDIRFNRNASACKWDMKVVYNDGDTSEFRNVDLCSVSRVSLFWNRQANSTRFVTE